MNRTFPNTTKFTRLKKKKKNTEKIGTNLIQKIASAVKRLKNGHATSSEVEAELASSPER